MTDHRIVRRRLLTTGAGALALTLAGCAGSADDATEEPTAATGTDEGSPAEDAGDGDGEGAATPYTVSMAPAGEVTFDAVPERWLSYFPGYADMGVALGQADGLQAVGLPSRYHTGYYDELDGVTVDREGLTAIFAEGIDKELYFELDCDVHLTDPEWLVNNSAFGLDADDVAEIDDLVAPFLGNTIFRRTDPWHDYRYYSMYEAFEKVAAVFHEEERYAAFREFHDAYVARVQAELPPVDDRPNAMLVWADGDEPAEFFPYRLSDRGTNTKQFRDLGIDDALAGTGIQGLSTSERGSVDYETLLEVDPDVLLVRGYEDRTAAEFADTVLAHMADHDVASDLAAVEAGQVFRGGPIYQGPIQHLFTLERAATELFADTFEGELFDRERVADIVTGDA